MGKITRTASAKHEASLSPGISAFIQKFTNAPLHLLPSELSKFPKRWPFSRGDLYHWIDLLNRFDVILELFISLYGLNEGPQTQAFSRKLLLQSEGKWRGDGLSANGASENNVENTPVTEELLNQLGFREDADGELIETILWFTQRLLENCSNRSLYASSGRLNDLLNTTSLSLLERTLRLGHRLAQRYAMSRHKAGQQQSHTINMTLLHTHYMLDLDRVEQIAQPFLNALEPLNSSGMTGAPHPRLPEIDSKAALARPDLLTLVMDSNALQWQKNDLTHIKFAEKSSNNNSAQSISTSSSSNPADPVQGPSTPTPVRRQPVQQPHSATSESRAPAENYSLSSSADDSGLQHVNMISLSSLKVANAPLNSLVQEHMENVPQEQRYEFLQKLRIAAAWASGRDPERQRMVAMRLLAIMNLAYIYPEHMFQQKVLQQDQEEPRRMQLPQQLCDMLHPPGHDASVVPKRLQSLALATLESLLGFKSKLPDVTTALNVSASHGVLAFAVRKAVSELKSGESYDSFIKAKSSSLEPFDNHDGLDTDDLFWLDSLFSLLQDFPKSGRISESVVSTGLLEMLLEALNSRTVRAHNEYPKILSLVDGFVFHTRDALQHLVDSNGLDAISNLLAFEVDTALTLVSENRGMPTEWKIQSTDFDIPFLQQQTLILIFKLLGTFMSVNSGLFDRLLRNLIESSQLLNGLKLVISKPQNFGSNVWSGAVSVLSGFIHSEPTSYAAIAEAGLTRAFLETVTAKPLPSANEASQNGNSAPISVVASSSDSDATHHSGSSENTVPGIPASGDSIGAIPGAFSAICLNESGTDQVLLSGALRTFIKIFTSPKHVKALVGSSAEVDELGDGFEELARHHPRLKDEIIRIVVELTEDVRSFAVKATSEQPFGPGLYVLNRQGEAVVDGGMNAMKAGLPAFKNKASLSNDEDVEMKDAPSSCIGGDQEGVIAFEKFERLRKENRQSTVSETISVFSSFVFGFMKNSDLSSAFAASKGVENLLDLATSTILSFDPSGPGVHAGRLTKLIHILCENKPHLILPSIVKRLLRVVEQLSWFAKRESAPPFSQPYLKDLGALVHADNYIAGEGTNFVRLLARMVDISSLLTRCLQSFHQQRTTSHPIVQVNLIDLWVPLIAKLGDLQAACIWEFGYLQQLDPLSWSKSSGYATAAGVSFGDGEPSNVAASTRANELGSMATSQESQAISESDQTTQSSDQLKKQTDAQERNMYVIRHTLSQAPLAISALFNCMGKTVLAKRFPSEHYKWSHVVLIANSLARVFVKQLDLKQMLDKPTQVSDHYRMTIMSLASHAMVDKKAEPTERNSTVPLLTFLIKSFRDLGGFVRLGDILVKSSKELLSIKQDEEASDQSRRTQSMLFNGISSTLKFFLHVVTSKNVLEASQTAALSARGNERASSGFFSGHQLLVELRISVIRSMMPLWNSENIHSMPSDLIKILANILQQVQDTGGELYALKRSGQNSQPRADLNLVTYKLQHPDLLTRLIGNDNDDSLAREALYRCYENYTPAKEYCEYYKHNENVERYPIPSWDSSLSPQNNENEAESGDNNGKPNEESFPAGLHAILNNENITTPDIQDSDNALDLDVEDFPTKEGKEIVFVEDVQEERARLTDDLMDRCLTIVNAHDDVTFELASLITASTYKPDKPTRSDSSKPSERDWKLQPQDVCGTLIQSLISYQGTDDTEGIDKKVASCAHLLGIILQEKHFFEAASEELKDSFPSLVAYLSTPTEPAGEKPPIFTRQIMLILERILAEDAQPTSINWEVPKSEDAPLPASEAEPAEPFISEEEKTELFTVLVDMMPRLGKDASLALSVVRLMVNLTRTRSLAGRLGERKNLQKLFVMIKQLADHIDFRFRAAFMIVIRHIVEDEETVKQLMRSGIRSMFYKPPQQIDISAYSRDMNPYVLRDPQLFVEVTNEILTIPSFNGGKQNQTLALKNDTSEDNKNGTAGKTEASTAVSNNAEGEPVDATQATENDGPVEKVKGTELRAPTVENPDGLIHYLLSELLSYKDVEDKSSVSSIEQPKQQFSGSKDVEMATDDGISMSAINNTATESKSDEKPAFKPEEHPIFLYRCFILQCLSELLQSYNKAKIEFINYSRKPEPQATTPSKPRSGVLNYILNVLIPTGSTQHPDDIPSKKRDVTSNCAIGVISALCQRTSEKGSLKRRDALDAEDEPELLFIRRFVLEHALKAYKDANSSSDALEVKYSKLLALADLFNRMLAGRPNFSSSLRRHQETREDSLVPSQEQIAKIMFEKNFISALTNSISDIDLNVLGNGRVIKYILRPLKLLTHTAIDLSWSSDISTSPGRTDEDEISSATSISEGEDFEQREETPDLFRNSTLGMFEPGRENESSSASSVGSEDEDEMYGDAYADDMEFDEEGEEEDEVASDEDEERDDFGPMEGLSGDIGMDVEIELDGSDDVEDSDNDTDDSEEDDEDEDDEEMDDDDIEIMDEIEADGRHDLDDGENDWHDEGDDDDDYDDEDEHHVELDLAQLPAGLSADSRSDNEDGRPFPSTVVDPTLEHDEIEYLDSTDAMDHDGHGDDDSEGDDEEDEEGDEEDGEDMIFAGGEFDEDDSEMPPFAFGLEGWHTSRRATGHNRSWLSTFGRPERTLVPGYASHRPGAMPRGTDDGVNPLLERARPLTETLPFAAGRRTGTHGLPLDLPFLPRFNALPSQADPSNPITYISELLSALGNSHASLTRLQNGLQHLTNHHGLGPAIQFSMSQRPGRLNDLETVLEITHSNPTHHHHRHQHGHHHHHHHHHHLPPPPPLANVDPHVVVTTSSSTVERWQEEAKLIFGASVSEKSQSVNGAILRLLVPKAMEVERERKAKALEQTKREEEERARELAEKEAREKKEREEREAREAEERAAAAAAAAAEAAEAEERAENGGDSNAAAGDAMEGVEATNTEPSTANVASTSETQPRVYTNIRGRQVDITDLGIDQAYLEALPEELREEVIMQRYTEQRSEAAAAGEELTAINQEFLDALPEDIRTDLQQHEEQIRRRRERQEENRRRAASGAPAGAEEMDTASFMATLDPIMRQSVLADMDEDTLSQLPPELVAEARSLGGYRRRPLDPTRLMASGSDFITAMGRATGETDNNRSATNRPQRRPIVQMLDKAGVATLLRLMFVPIHGLSRSNLNGILRNASGNYQTRAEVVSGLLSILQDGSADTSAIERSFSQLSSKAKQGGAANKTPQSTKKNQPSALLNTLDSSPLTVIGHCLSALAFLTKELPHVPKFFLTEHELTGSHKSKASRKGKAKETRASKFPINALLGLLDRSIVVESSSIMDHLANLLQNVTQPLPSMLKKDREEQQTGTPSAQPTNNGAEPSSGGINPGLSGHRPEDNLLQIIMQRAMQAESDDPPSQSQAQQAPQDQSGNAATTTAPHDAKASEPKKSFTPPEIPDENLRLVINILTARDCSSGTFRDTLSTINNLSTIPSAKKVFGEELVKRARSLGQKIQADLAQLIKALQNAQNEMEAQSLTLANFSPAGSDQSKLSRILTALDYLFEIKSNEKETEQDEILTKLYEDPKFSALWHQLSACLSATQQAEKYFLNVATILLPLIESLMVVCKSLAVDPRKSGRESIPTTPAIESNMRTIFFNFTNRHKKILNDLVRHNPKLMSGSFAVLVKNSSVLEFDNKRNYFTRRLHHRTSDMRYPHAPLQLNVRRDHVFMDSYSALYFRKAEEIKYGKLNIRFINEEGVDAGGVTREWFQVLARQMFDPSYALFNPVASDRTTFHPNPLSGINDEHLKFFKFIGRTIGKALYENRVLDCHFSRAVYKQIIGNSVSMKDMETIDLDYTKSLQWMLDNDITDVLTETFSITKDNFGATEVIDLVPNGRNIPVTDLNKHEYVRLIIEYKLTGSVQDQLKSFLEGFHDIVPPELISIFDEGELELLISGMPEIDVDDWKSHTEYTGYTSTSPQIQWFWRAVRSFDKEERAKLLQFVTGTGKVPLNGFKELEGMNGFTKFSIHKDFGNKDRLPSSHTCFNQLDLPEYDSYEQLRKCLYTAMTTGGEYFGFA